MQNKKVFTTGDIANLLHVHQTTVIDWVDKGMIESYKTPGGHRRISREGLFKFANKHNMPLPNILKKGPSNQREDEGHRHLHEGYQIGPVTKPQAGKQPLPKKRSGTRNPKRKKNLVKKK